MYVLVRPFQFECGRGPSMATVLIAVYMLESVPPDLEAATTSQHIQFPLSIYGTSAQMQMEDDVVGASGVYMAKVLYLLVQSPLVSVL